MKYLYLCMSILLILSGCEADDKIIIDKPKENTVFVFIKNSHSFEDLYNHMDFQLKINHTYTNCHQEIYMTSESNYPDTMIVRANYRLWIGSSFYWEIYMSLPYYGTDRYRRFISPLYMQIGIEAPDTVFFHYPEDTVSCISVDLSPFHCPQDTVYYDWN